VACMRCADCLVASGWHIIAKTGGHGRVWGSRGAEGSIVAWPGLSEESVPLWFTSQKSKLC